ncbi:MAG: UDP-N-acetylmuramoyl-L-alanine--D-glutamate ligase, partial [Micavibrio aeruginosavorus]
SPGIPHYGPNAHPLAVEAQETAIPLVCDIELLAQSIENDILAITGTNGKSTTTALLAHALAQFRPVEMGGNIGNPVLQLNSLDKNGSYILELSSYQLELSPSLRPAGAILLNITPDHLARHGDMETYIRAKENIFAGIHRNGRKPVAVIAIDSDVTKRIAERVKLEGNWQVVTVSTQGKAMVYAESSKLYDGDVQVMDLSLTPAFKGQHNHENAACAYALMRHLYGYEPEKIASAMSSFQGLPHRQHLVRTINGISYINDSKATNAEATGHALACTRNIYWILGGQAKEGGLKGLENYMDRITHAFLIGEAAEEFAKWLKASDIPHTICGTLDVAVEAAHKLAQDNRGMPGEPATVLLSPACASWDQFKSFEHRGDVFTGLVEKLPEE